MSHSRLPYFGYRLVFATIVSPEMETIAVYTVYFCSQQVTRINDQCAVCCLNFTVGGGGCVVSIEELKRTEMPLLLNVMFEKENARDY